jgi:hypothetical protein
MFLFTFAAESAIIFHLANLPNDKKNGCCNCFVMCWRFLTIDGCFGNMCIVFTALCIVCLVFLYCFVYVYLFLFVLCVLVSGLLQPRENIIQASKEAKQSIVKQSKAKQKQSKAKQSK